MIRLRENGQALQVGIGVQLPEPWGQAWGYVERGGGCLVSGMSFHPQDRPSDCSTEEARENGGLDHASLRFEAAPLPWWASILLNQASAKMIVLMEPINKRYGHAQP